MEQFPILITAAFVLGLGVRFVGLPPLVGFLLAGFCMNAAGYSSTPELEHVADLGVTVLLFTIGLKLRVSSLLRPEVWAGATLQMALTVGLFCALFLVLPFGLFGGLSLSTAALIAFALSFSSTVFAVKVFEEQGQSRSLHARTAVGILIVQDVIAVIFLAASTGKVPSPWALALLALIPGRHLLKWLMERCGHGELLLLLGIMMTFAGSELFELVKLKGDLGALIFGMLVAGHPKAKEMASSLLSFKDLFLVGFFLSIGLRGIPSLPDLAIALFLVALVPIKVALYFGVLTRFRLRARTSAMAALGLAEYSEFGLIVGALGASMGWLSDQWLLIIAVAVAVTFVLASPLNAAAHRIYDHLRPWLIRFQTDKRVPDEQPVYVPAAEVLIFGMGRVGTGAYDAIASKLGGRVVGVDIDPDTVRRHVENGRDVVRGDPTDLDFCERVVHEGNLKRAMLALPNHRASLVAAAEIYPLKEKFGVIVTATAKHDDEVRELEENGVDAAFNLYAEAGQGYADFVSDKLD
ncbi:MAG: cation:proton antiporter [Deltaproteobacteria bacterium]|nr:cation:proton antiporter [Deltaproteobacteria bacterium]MBW1875560.1 cation:proton antiporter [Deltaproteobacteria bacterium]MBW2210661.1 cation:proton antiporter [Deltaproteobacteria bacterium]MBW2378240.1 cation:proton antiporter [Deltaproteobacteria bacterium]MBW2550281.1 cation:proton antiporter [Deltaproteobacteria bacterium]